MGIDTNEAARVGHASTEVLAGILGAGSGTIGRVFEFIDIAEEELAAARVPRKQKGVLNELYPGPFLGLDEQLYREHARELAHRIARGHDLAPGTLAEVMVAMMGASIVAPLSRNGAAVYEHLFVTLMPEQAKRIELVPTPETYAGQIATDIETARRQLIGKRVKPG